MADTAVPTIGEIITNLGGTPTAQTVVPALEELQAQLGDDGLRTYVFEYLAEQGASIGLSVSDGDLSITLS